MEEGKERRSEGFDKISPFGPGSFAQPLGAAADPNTASPLRNPLHPQTVLPLYSPKRDVRGIGGGAPRPVQLPSAPPGQC